MKLFIKTFLLLVSLIAIGFFFPDEIHDSNPLNHPAQKPTEAKKHEIWRAAKFGTPTQEQLVKSRNAFQSKLRSQPKKTTRDGGVNSWTELGPKGIGGRMNAFVIDPNNKSHIIGATETGGIWETFNEGGSWTLVDDFMASLVISDIEYDPFDDNTIYASTGLNRGSTFIDISGANIFKSTDNGATWGLANPTSTDTLSRVSNIVLDPANNGVIYASGQTLIWKSNDAGQNWIVVGSTFSPTNNIVIDPYNSKNVLIACDNRLFGSFNATSPGIIFSNLSNGNPGQLPSFNGRVEVAYAPSKQNHVYALIENTNGSNNELYESVDAGQTWTKISSSNIGNDARLSHSVIWVSPNDHKNIVIGGVDLRRSTDGGQNFVKISDWTEDIDGGGSTSIHADQFMIKADNNYNGGSVRKVFISNDGGLYSTNDILTVSENNGWISNVGDLANTQCYGGAVSNGKYIVGTQDNAFALSTDSGATWTQPTTGDGSRAAINPMNSNIMYANLNYNSIVKSTDGGSSWFLVATFGYSQDPTASFPGSWPTCAIGKSCASAGIFYADDFASLISPFVMDPNDSDNIIAGGTSLWKNTDGATTASWTRIKDTLPSRRQIFEIELAKNDSDNIWVSYSNGVIERTLDNGASWSGDISPSISVNTWPTGIAINPNNSSEVIVSYNSFNGTNLFYTSNGSSSNPTWTDISTDVEVAISTVAWHPTNCNWIYAGTTFGIFASENKGSSWSITPLYSGNEGPVNTEVAQLFFTSESTPILAAVTYGRGLWLSNPLRDKIYVDKNYAGTFEAGTIIAPYKSFKTAYDNAGNGAEIIFLSGGAYDNVSSSLLMKKRLKITGLGLSPSATVE